MPQESEILCSVILPVHNERPTILRNIRTLTERIRTEMAGSPFEVLLVDNGSNDGTRRELEAKGILRQIPELVYLRVSKKGRGVALKHAFPKCRGAYICIWSIDRSWDEQFIGEALQILESGIDVVYGPKTHPNSSVTRPCYRNCASIIIRRILSLLFGMKIPDTQCVKAFRMSSISFIERLNDYNYFAETEFFLLALQQNLNTRSIPVIVCDKRKDSKVKLTSFAEFFREALHFRLQQLG